MEGSVMIINVAYDHKKSFKKVKKESNKILGIKNKKNNVFEYNGMLISYNKSAIQINTLLTENVDFNFLVQILNSVFKDSSVGISGMSNNKNLPGIEGVNVFWI